MTMLIVCHVLIVKYSLPCNDWFQIWQITVIWVKSTVLNALKMINKMYI